jgi:L-ribulose-5-phosphate 3-epimerase
MNHALERRDLLKATLAGVALAASPSLLSAQNAEKVDTKKPKLKKAVKYGMIRAGNSIQEKFELIKKIGFVGVEFDSPSNINREEAVKAKQATGIEIHGVVDSIHWRDTLSSPDEAVRAKGLAGLNTALDDAKFYGAETVLLVPGVVKDGVTYEQCYERSQAEVKKVLPKAKELGVKIGIEVVWNNFITKPEQLVQYVDDFKDPIIGAYFDSSNMIKYGVKPGDWIRKLGKRMIKFDLKGYSNTKQWVAIGEGDEDWPDILKALDEVGYQGWATAEVSGGGEKELTDIFDRMSKVLGG